MDIDGNGKIDQYETAVFFLKLAAYDRLIDQEKIMRHMDIVPAGTQEG